MIDYGDVVSLTNQGIDEFAGSGGEYTLIISPGTVEIIGGIEYSKPEETGTVKGVIRGFSFKFVDGENILAGDKRGFFGGDVAIETGMFIVIKSERWRVVDNRPVNPTGDQVIAYRPVLRRLGGG